MKRIRSILLLVSCGLWLSVGLLAKTSFAQNNPIPEAGYKRIITLAPHVVEMLFSLGVGSRIVGTSEYSDFPKQALSITKVGNYAGLSIEHILTLEPDLVIAWKTGTPEGDLQRLKDLGIKVIYSHPQQLSDIAKELRMLGSLTNTQTKAEQLAGEFEQQLQELKHQYQGKNQIRVFYELWSKPVTTIAGHAWPQQHLNICAAENPFKAMANDYPQVNLEQVLLSNPQVIIVPTTKGTSHPERIDWSQYPELDASKHQQFITPDADILHRMSLRLLPELSTLCQALDNSRMYYQKQAKQ
ncbi:cobalamin-binding protein [Thalassotalea aquiviva]|uniref:cobalamin-binding protein n=1 Tax=Thalassotalea aquiviva TaxID=3242415 RepID=UPI00352B51A3